MHVPARLGGGGASEAWYPALSRTLTPATVRVSQEELVIRACLGVWSFGADVAGGGGWRGDR